jgi:hypothetical protein
MALHVAGVEVSFASQILGLSLSPLDAKIKLSATEGVVNDHPFPFDEQEVTAEAVEGALNRARTMVTPLLENPSTENLTIPLKSALGPMITGEGALARFAFHPAYHQGQAYLIKGAPGFPA